MPKRAEDSRDVAKFDLKAAREARSLSQIATAEILMATQSSVSRWEIDGSIPAIYKAYWDLYWSAKDNDAAKIKQEEKPAKNPQSKDGNTGQVGRSPRSDTVPRRRRNS